MNADDVRHIARLARIRLTDDEVERFTRDLSAIVAEFDRLRAIDVSSVTDDEILVPNPELPATSPRDDGASDARRLALGDLLAAAPDATEDGRYRVPAYFGDEPAA